MYFALEYQGRRRVVFARESIGITEVTRKAFGPNTTDARVIKAHSKRAVAENALFEDVFPKPLKEVASNGRIEAAN